VRATPLPSSWNGPRAVSGPDEYAGRPSVEYPGRWRYLVRVELDDLDRDLVARGGVLWLDLDGEVPWCIHVTGPDGEVPA
jgi:hypothetical protein